MESQCATRINVMLRIAGAGTELPLPCTGATVKRNAVTIGFARGLPIVYAYITVIEACRDTAEPTIIELSLDTRHDASTGRIGRSHAIVTGKFPPTARDLRPGGR